MSISCEHYDIEVFADENLVVETFRGVWSTEIARSYEQDYRRAATKLDSEARPVCLSDLRKFPVQSQEVAQLMLALLENPGMEFARIAVVTQSAIMNLQAKRVAGNSNKQVFADKTFALRWLRAEDDKSAT